MLTTREAVDLAAFLEFPDLPKSKRDELVESSLDALGLKAVQHRPIGDRATGGGGLSGGERRRLSVALELLSTPHLFLADEPTTGLDSAQAGKVLHLIAQLAKERHIPCLCTLHQPRASIWKMFDSFILLGPGGRVCYMGSRKNATKYFAELGYNCPQETNPAEFFIDLVSVDTEDPIEAAKDEARIEKLAKAFSLRLKKSKESDSTWQPPSKSIAVSSKAAVHPFRLIRRSLALLRRSWRQNVRNHKVNALRLGAAIGNSLLFSAIFGTVRGAPSTKSVADRVALLSFGVINMSMVRAWVRRMWRKQFFRNTLTFDVDSCKCKMALMKTIDLFAKERPVVDREQMRSQYSSLEYLLAKSFAEIPLDTLFAAVFTTVLKATTGLCIPLTQLTATFSLMTVAGAALGFAIGSCTPNADAALATGVPLMVIFMVVGIINPSGVDKTRPPPQFLQYLKLASPIMWAVEALCIAEYSGMEFEEKNARWPWQRFRDLPKLGGLAMVRNGDQVLEALGLENSTYDGVMEKLAILSGIYLLISWAGLHYGGTSFEQASMADWGPAQSKNTSTPIVRRLH